MNRIALFTALFCAVGSAQGTDRKSTKSGLQYEVIKPGRADGKSPTAWDRAKVHYTGWLQSNGAKFDSSRDKGKPFDFPVGVGAVIAGWDEGVQLMKEGARFKFFIPARLAYGARGAGNGAIPPNSDLLFEVELIRVKPGHKPEFFAPREGKSKTLPSGLKYEVLVPGEGEPVRGSQGARMSFVLWNQSGEVVLATPISRMRIAGPLHKLGIKQLPPKFWPKFWAEAAGLMRRGSVLRFEVPPELCWGAQAVTQKLPANSTTIWELKMEEVFTAPEFVKAPADRLETTASGLAYEVIKPGAGPKPTLRDVVEVHYTGWTLDGKLFDSSQLRGEPAKFPLGGVIKGWQEGLRLMGVGAVYRFTIPAELAYGEKPKRPGAPAGTLIFWVELLKIGE